MRISTAGMHRVSISGILENQVKLAKTQNQVATGRKFQTASEDPIGATRVAGLERKLADNAQYERNSNILESRLSYEEQTLADITSLLQSARDSALAGANATLGQAERKMIANQVRQNLAGLMEMANRQDANGEYLFAGFWRERSPIGSIGEFLKCNQMAWLRFAPCSLDPANLRRNIRVVLFNRAN